MVAVDIDLIGVPAWVIDVGERGDLRFAALNRANMEVTGLRAQHATGRCLHECLPPDVADHVAARYTECIEKRSLHEYDEMLEIPGHERWWRTTLTPVIDQSTGRVTRIVGVAVEITERKQLEYELADAAFRDPLTGVANRRRLAIAVDDAMSEAVYTNKTFGLIVADLDGFKAVNDTLGHTKGDDVLRHIASLLSLAARDNETVSRIGGDEFAMLVRASSHLELATKVTMLRHSLDRSMSVSDVETTVGVSVGAGLWLPAQTFEDLLSVADMEMYHQKARRRSAAASSAPLHDEAA
ncbi:GGDEF domain-containing protein [Aurantimonas sp. A2-1-M11]|uniref:GGDEF domain-containing protein n=1 Tax=Aurantimonas sp. A2-1-M11 TaxID=3113712 RepID=UPI002F9443E7